MRPFSDTICEKNPPLLFRIIMQPLSWIYECCVRIRNFLYDRKILPTHRLDGHCIAVGNLSVGGTGKSPFVAQLASYLLEKGFQPAILTRGYGSSLSAKECLVLLGGKIVLGNSELRKRPDEAMMQSNALPSVPVIVGRDRKGAARTFLKSEICKPTHWILDDGFQHRCLARDLEIVLIDAEFFLGNGALLPFGTLREPVSSLKRADIICLTRAGANAPTAETRLFLQMLNSKAPQIPVRFTSRVGKALTGESFSSIYEPLLLMCGIAQPERFQNDLTGQGIRTGATYFVADHAEFDRETLFSKLSGCRGIATTWKDYWRNPAFFANLSIPVFVVHLEVELAETDKALLFCHLGQGFLGGTSCAVSSKPPPC